MNLKKIKDELNEYGEFVFDMGIVFPDFIPQSHQEERELYNKIFKLSGYPKDQLVDGENWVVVESEFAPFDTIYGKDHTVFGTFGAVSNTDNVDVIRKIMSDYVSKYYDGDVEIMIEGYRE